MYTILNLAFLKTYQLTNSFHRRCTRRGTYIYIFLTFLFLLSIRILYKLYKLSCVERSFRFFQSVLQYKWCHNEINVHLSLAQVQVYVWDICLQISFWFRRCLQFWIFYFINMSERIQVTVYPRKFFAVNEIGVERRTFRTSQPQLRWLWYSGGTAMITEWKQLTCTCSAEGDLGKTGVQPTKTFLSGFPMKSMCLVFNLEINLKIGGKKLSKVAIHLTFTDSRRPFLVGYLAIPLYDVIIRGLSWTTSIHLNVIWLTSSWTWLRE